VASSIWLAAQCAVALSMMPANAPSCWTQGFIAAAYIEYVIQVLSKSFARPYAHTSFPSVPNRTHLRHLGFAQKAVDLLVSAFPDALDLFDGASRDVSTVIRSRFKR
jgi:hypothetical protein